MSKKSLVPVNILALASAPSGAHVGDMYINTTDYTLNVYDGATWSATYLTAETVADLISNAALGNTDDLAEGINNKYFTVTRLVDTLNAGTLENITFTYANGAINTSVPTVQGATGTQGVQGAEGPQGVLGAQGAAGTQGSVGADGPQGMQGATGTTGMQGANGSDGAQGATGATGPEGAQGVQGTQGVIGNTGATGADGVQGATGTQGAEGPQGTTGSQGVQGPLPWVLIGPYDNGANYTYGNAVTYEGGFYYRTGNPNNPGYPPTPGSINESWTPVADRGLQGVQGIQGPDGVQGILGAQGATGAQGPEGTQGATGTQGVQGAEGPQGTQGTQGIQGVQGYQGADGNSSSYYNYKIDANGTYGDPGAGGFILYNNATQTSATELSIDHLTFNDVDIDIFLALLKVGDTLVIQDSNNSDNYQQWLVNGNETIYPNNYATVPVELTGSAGTGTTGFADNHPVILVIVASGVQGPTGTQGTTGAQGIQGLQGATGTISPDDSWYYSLVF